VQASIFVPEPLQDFCVEALAMVGFSGFLHESDRIECYTESIHWKPKTRKIIQILLEHFATRFSLSPILWKTEIIREENWNKRWEAETGIVEATKGIIIKPSWASLRKRDNGKMILHIDPKMSFGTGHHETTRLCLLFLEEFLLPDSTVLDLGTGTGVLAIAAAKLGAKRVWAIDNDAWSIQNARENILRNRTGKRVVLRDADLAGLSKRRFDIVVANLDLVTVTQFAPRIIASVNPRGLLIISGILSNDSPHIRKTFLNDFRLLRTQTQGEWTAFAFRRT
jgi:ribosomal protein L11 methyltransferase